MKKLITGSLLAILLLPVTHVSAQINKSVQVAKNLANLERAIARASAPAIGRPVVTHLPAGIVPGNAVGLRRVEIPRVITPVSLSYIQYVRTLGKNHLDVIPHNWIGPKGERVLYENQDQLARDLEAFYKGKADIYKGPDGRKVKLYMLPSDGILYMPPEYEIPLVLNSDEYFVVYDVTSKTGKIVENTAQVYNTYKRYRPTELHKDLERLYAHLKMAVATNQGLTGTLDHKVEQTIHRFPEEPASRAISQASNGFSFSNLNRELRALVVPMAKNDVSIYQLEKEMNARYRMTGHWKEVWKEKNLPNVFYSEVELGRALYKIHKHFGAVVRNLVTEEVFRVYELPVTGLVMSSNGANIELDGNEYVVLYKNDTAATLMDRATLEHSTNFQFYNHYFLY